ncbi:MAG TPA: methyltransferase domain-containing protein [Stellaceae bacterium]|nr:methyltransferase domain-containing protein [Stellaceae bacterium]
MQTAVDEAARAYWESRARDWRVSPPLTPGPEDIAWYEARIADCARSVASRPLKAILLGVTPGIATMRWPKGTALLAVDRAQGMVEHVWPRAGFPEQTDIVRADWRCLPLASGSVDVVVGDGCYAAMGSLAGARQLNREVRRVLKPGGWYCFRAFRRSDEPSSLVALFAELERGRVENLDLFRWRLAMLVHGDSAEGVALGKVWRVWRDHARGHGTDGRRWSADQRLNMARWEGVEARFAFPSLAELEALAEPSFDLVACEWPAYEGGEHFPRISMRARPGEGSAP